MPHIAIIYFSETDTTHNIALSIGDGCSSVSDTVVNYHRIDGSEIKNGRFKTTETLTLVDNSDAVVFGSPTYMGGPAAQFKAFADATSDRWEEQQWSGKLATGFTVGANANGDQLATLQYFSILASQHGMLWVNLNIPGGSDPKGRNPLGSQLGFAAHCLTPTLTQADKDTAFHLGARVARTAIKLS